MFRGDHDAQGAFGDRIGPAYGLSIGKWFSPYFGARIDFAGHTQKGLTQNNTDSGYSTGEAYSGKSGWGYWLYHQEFNFINLQADLLFNARTILLGDKPDQLWDPVPYIGVGFANVLTKPSNNSVSFNAGLLNSFNLSDSFAIFLDIKGMAAFDEFDGETGGRTLDGMVTVAAGVTYKF